MAQDKEKKREILADANQAKDRLYEIVCKLEEEGYFRKAKSGMNLIYAIEEWQNRN